MIISDAIFASLKTQIQNSKFRNMLGTLEHKFMLYRFGI